MCIENKPKTISKTLAIIILGAEFIGYLNFLVPLSHFVKHVLLFKKLILKYS